MEKTNIERINDDAIRGGWSPKYEVGDYKKIIFDGYQSPFFDPEFWKAVRRAREERDEYFGDMWPTTSTYQASALTFMKNMLDGMTMEEALENL